MNYSTEKTREDLSIACNDLEQSIHEFKIQCGCNDWEEKIVNITTEFTEIFPDVMVKVAFPEKKGGSRTIIIKAKGGSKLDPHKMMPTRFVYVVQGDQRDERGVIVLNEDEGMTIKPFVETSMYFTVDTKLIMEVEEQAA